MDLKENRGERFQENFHEEAFHTQGELFVAQETFFQEDFDEDELGEEGEEEVPSYGVYFQGKEKTLLGLFWDEELANLFMNSIKNSNVLEKVKEIA